MGSVTTKNHLTTHYDKVLRHITRLLHCHIDFTAFDDIFLHWLEATSNLEIEEPIHSLPRLFPREADATNFEQADLAIANASVDPWKVVTRVAAEGKAGLGRALKWLCLLARSGVDIPMNIFKTFSAFFARDGVSLAESSLFAKAVMASTWLKPRGRQEIQALVSQLHEKLGLQIKNDLRSDRRSDDM
ncbi:hypothetical protein C0991_003852 [Blastosporella zonata]|nr:hypothetical protein C0991_003852 [Blastosporella zonata]